MRYPGDLAMEVDGGRGRWWPRSVGVLVTGAAAAILVVVLLKGAIDPKPPTRVERVPQTQREQVVMTMPALPQMPAMPSMAWEFEGPMLLPALPGFPSLVRDDELEEEFPTTQESL